MRRPSPVSPALRPRTDFRHARVLSIVAAAAFLAAAVAPSADAPSADAPSRPTVWTRSAGAPVAAAADDDREPTAPVEPYAEHDGQESCRPEEQPGVQAFRDLVLAAYPGTEDGGIVRDCAVGGRSEHKEGRAWDWMLDANDAEDAAAAAEVLEWLLAPDGEGEPHAVARRLGVMYVIWDGRIWKSSQPGAWQDYRGVSPHEDHVHITFGHDGAAGTTSFWDPVWQPEVGAAYPAVRPAEDVEVRAAPSRLGADGAPAG